MRTRAACAILILTSCGTAFAAATAGQTVAGWSTTPTPSDGVCLIGHQLVDKDKKKGSVVYGLFNGGFATDLIVTLSYQGWHFKPGEPVAVDLIIGDKALAGKASWVGDAETLSYTFNNASSLIDLLGTAPTLTARIADVEAKFPTPNAASAFAAAKTCLSGAK